MTAVLKSLFGDAGPVFWTFAFVSILMAGAAAISSGRALALSWRPLGQCALYGAFIALAASFLHYALFQEIVISLTDIGNALATVPQSPVAGIGALLASLKGFGIEFVLQTLFAIAGYRLTRAGQMYRQYRFARK